MPWYLIALIALAIYSAIGTIIAIFGKDEWLEYWSIGFIGLLLWIITYPIRAWRRYGRSIGYYKKRNISRLQFMLGKRANHSKEESGDV